MIEETSIDTNDETMTEETEAGFRRLHPLSIIMKSLAALGQNLFAVVVLYFSVLDQNLFYALLAAIGLVLFIGIINLLIWSRFSYQIGAQDIRIKSGLLSRNNRSIPFDRIQDVSLEQKLLARILGLATVKLETGASGGQDDKLEALALADAEAFRDILKDYKSGISVSTSEALYEDQTSERRPLFAMDAKRILVAGLFNFSFVLFAVVAALAQNLDFILDVPYFEIEYWADRLGDTEFVDGLSLAGRMFGVGAAILSLILVGTISGIVRTVIREYGFRLERVTSGQDGFRRRRGLFTLTDMVMPIHRVQAAIVKTGPIRQRFGWHHLKFQSLASDVGGESDHSAAPCAKMDEIDPILVEAKIENVTQDLQFNKVSPAHWWRDALLVVMVLAAIGIGNGMFVHPAVYALPLLALPIAVIMYLNWRHHQYALDGEQLFVRSGWWSRRLTILPLRKIQTVDVSQSPFDHPLNLASLVVGVAGGSTIRPLRIKDIARGEAMNLRARLLIANHA